MIKKILPRACMLLLAIYIVTPVVKAQNEIPCYYWYDREIQQIRLICWYLPPDNNTAPVCPEGQVAACRYKKNCNIECQCMSLDTAALIAWTSAGKDCVNHGGPGNGNGGGPWHHGGWRSSVEDNNEGNITFFSGISPNPVTDITTISFWLSRSQNVNIQLFDVNGRLISRLADQPFNEGKNEFVWNASSMTAGMYIIQLQAAELSHTQRIVVTR